MLRSKHCPGQNFRAVALAFLCVAPLLTGCSASSYAGISLAGGTPNSELKELATRARGGDKQAQFDLAERFETGRGVARDLERARQLYVRAARDTKARASLYIATPGGRTASIQREYADTRSDGLAEAKMRLLQLGAESPRAQAQDFEAKDPDVMRDKGVLLYGYQPIFNGLKSSHGDWRERIMAEGAAFPVTEESLNETLSLLALPSPSSWTVEAVPASDKLHAFCSAALTAPIADRAEMRRAGLCIARFPQLAAPVVGGLGAALLRDMPAGAVPATTDNALLAQELIFFYRVLRHCDCGSPTLRRDILAAVARLVPPFAAEIRSCASLNCPGFDHSAYRAYAIAAVSLVEAVMEAPDLARDPDVKDAIAAAASLPAKRQGSSPSGALVSGELRSFCMEAALEYAACRKQFRRNPQLFGALVGNLAAYLIDRSRGGAGCDGLRTLNSELQPELLWEPDLRRLFGNTVQHLCSGE